MTSLRWLKLNRTGLCYLPEELAALQKLVRGFGQSGRGWGWGWARWAEPAQKGNDLEEDADSHEQEPAGRE